MGKTVPLGLTLQEVQRQEREVSAPPPRKSLRTGAVLGGPAR